MNKELKFLLKEELDRYRFARKQKYHKTCFYRLGRAHIIAQSNVIMHLYIHFIMLGYAIRRFDAREVVGQLVRITVTIPGHIFGKVPKGNIGWSKMKLNREMPIPKDLKAKLAVKEKNE